MAYTQIEVDKRSSDYICLPCGLNFITKEEYYFKTNGVVTYHEGICGLCNEVKSICHIRHYNYLHIAKEESVADMRLRLDEKRDREQEFKDIGNEELKLDNVQM